jgi:hypothetical protein
MATLPLFLVVLWSCSPVNAKASTVGAAVTQGKQHAMKATEEQPQGL